MIEPPNLNDFLSGGSRNKELRKRNEKATFG